jgi:uncharacterized protein (TIGR02099 family)
LQARFNDLGWSAYEQLPGARGLDGSLSFTPTGGRAVLDSRDVVYEQPKVFWEALNAQSLRADIAWTQSDSDGLRVEVAQAELANADLRLAGRGTLELAGSDPVLDIQARFETPATPRVSRYLPRISAEPLRRWFDEALVRGRVTDGSLVLRGPVRRFPFRADEGVFEARFRMEGVGLNYRRDWPGLGEVDGEVLFRNAEFSAEVEDGRVLGSRVEGSVGISNLGRARLEVAARASGPLADVFGFLARSPLGSGRKAALDAVAADGRSRLSLELSLPLSRRLSEDPGVAGEIRLSGARLGIRGEDLALSQLEGELQFTDHGITARGVEADFRGEAVTLSAQTEGAQRIRIQAEGVLGIAQLLPGSPATLAARLQGRSPWQAEVTLPAFKADAGSVVPTLRLSSALEGVNVELPAPLGKPVTEARPFVLEMPLRRTSRGELRMSYGDVLSYRGRASEADWFDRGELRVGPGTPQPPAQGLRIVAAVPEVDAAAWAALRGEAQAGEATADSQLRRIGGRITAVGLDLGELRVAGQRFQAVKVDAVRGEDAWRGLISTSALAGTFEAPVALLSGRPLVLDLEHLVLQPGPEMSDGSEGIDPRRLPALRIISKELRWGERRFTDLRLEATRLADGLQLHALRLAAPGVAISGQGDWRRLAPGREQTSLRLVFDIDDAKAALESLALGASGMERGKGRLEASLRWPASPMRFAWEGLEGKARVELEEGRLVAVEPGAGRLLGLVNLGSLARRIRLDFSDVFQEGFAFDTLAGTLVARGPDIYTSDLTIEGPSASVSIRGRTNVLRREHEQIVTVVPEYTSGLPIAGFVLGGVGVGAAVLVVDRLLDLGGQINEANRLEYRVTGSWSEPDIVLISGPIRAADPQTEE